METVYFSEGSVCTYKSTFCHNPEKQHLHRRENLKPHNLQIYFLTCDKHAHYSYGKWLQYYYMSNLRRNKSSFHRCCTCPLGFGSLVIVTRRYVLTWTHLNTVVSTTVFCMLCGYIVTTPTLGKKYKLLMSSLAVYIYHIQCLSAQSTWWWRLKAPLRATINFHASTRRNIPEGSHVHNHINIPVNNISWQNIPVHLFTNFFSKIHFYPQDIS
jgi:hypothetical protein